MNNPCLIPTNFKVPKGHRHEFLIFWKNKRAGSIKGIPGRSKIAFQTWEIACTKKESALFHHFSMDWMAESIEHIRYLCAEDGLPPF